MFSRYFDQKCVLDLTAELKALILSTTIYPVPMGKVEISGYKTKNTRSRTKYLSSQGCSLNAMPFKESERALMIGREKSFYLVRG